MPNSWPFCYDRYAADFLQPSSYTTMNHLSTVFKAIFSLAYVSCYLYLLCPILWLQHFIASISKSFGDGVRCRCQSWRSFPSHSLQQQHDTTINLLCLDGVSTGRDKYTREPTPVVLDKLKSKLLVGIKFICCQTTWNVLHLRLFVLGCGRSNSRSTCQSRIGAISRHHLTNIYKYTMLLSKTGK